MIPKIIHYCWFGRNEKPEDVKKCIESWSKYLPDYEIIEWNEDNFDLNKTIMYVNQAYQSKKWAFVSDYVRIKVMYEYGGIYFDTDVEVFRNFDDLLSNHSFLGFESKDYIATSVMGAEPKNHLIGEFIDIYSDKKFIKPDGSYDFENTNVVYMTNILLKHGAKMNGKEQMVDDIKIYPQKYFSSNNFINIFGKYKKDIYAYHHCAASWYKESFSKSKMDLLRHYLIGLARNSIGTNTLRWLKSLK